MYRLTISPETKAILVAVYLVQIDDLTTDEGQPGRHASCWPTRLFVLATSPEMMVDKVICPGDMAR